MNVRENRAILIQMMQDVIKNDERFDINSIHDCMLGKLQYIHSGHFFPGFNPERVAEFFGISEKSAINLFMLNYSNETKADPTKYRDARYHLRRAKRCFKNYPV